jgi:HAD superfamily hydrolase (TIGR01509 family)
MIDTRNEALWMSQLDLLIFDCDGVLIDSEPLASRVLAESIYRVSGIAISPREALIAFTGASADETQTIMRERYGINDPATVMADYDAHLFPQFHRHLKEMAGISQVLDALDIRKCVASNSRLERLVNSLGILPIWRHFAPHVYGADMVACGKPAPDLPLLCLERCGVDPERALFIDDSPHGIIAAKAAGIRAVGFIAPNDPRTGRADLLLGAGADHIARGAGELYDIVLDMHVQEKTFTLDA